MYSISAVQGQRHTLKSLLPETYFQGFLSITTYLPLLLFTSTESYEHLLTFGLKGTQDLF